MRILGIDPGFGRTGWGVIEIGTRGKISLIAAGVIETFAKFKVETSKSKTKFANSMTVADLRGVAITSHGIKLKEGEIEIPFNLRILELNSELTKILNEHKPEEVAIEELFFFKNQKTVINVAQARGVIVLTCLEYLDGCAHKLHEYTPLQVKNTITGYGRADKNQVNFMVKQLLKESEIKLIDDAIDALAIAITHYQNSAIIK